MDTEWANTLVDSTPTQCRERGFFIYLNYENEYEIGNILVGGYGAPDERVSLIFWYNWDLRIVGFFHTHPPISYAPTGSYRKTGYSKGDEDAANDLKLPGFVYDYEASEIEGGHSETNATKIYRFGPARRRLEK